MSEHSFGSPIFREESGRWLVECSCGWDRESDYRDEAMRLIHGHLLAPESSAEMYRRLKPGKADEKGIA